MAQYKVHNLTQGNLTITVVKPISLEEQLKLPRHKRHKAIRTANTSVSIARTFNLDMLKETDLTVEELNNDPELCLLTKQQKVRVEIIEDVSEAPIKVSEAKPEPPKVEADAPPREAPEPPKPPVSTGGSYQKKKRKKKK